MYLSNLLERFESNDRLSQVVKLNQFVEMSGMVAECESIDIIDQTESVLDQLDARLKSLGLNRNHLIRIQIWLADMQDFAGMNQVYDAWFKDYEKPARACVGAQLAEPQYRIEIQASAAL